MWKIPPVVVVACGNHRFSICSVETFRISAFRISADVYQRQSSIRVIAGLDPAIHHARHKVDHQKRGGLPGRRRFCGSSPRFAARGRRGRTVHLQRAGLCNRARSSRRGRSSYWGDPGIGGRSRETHRHTVTCSQTGRLRRIGISVKIWRTPSTKDDLN
jgi:hypothetical protein